jgi:hypothetical protein
MLETIRHFAEEQLVASGEADEVRATHSRFFAEQEANVLAQWDSPRQRESYYWFSLEVANLRAAFRWAADHDDLDSAAAIAVYASILGSWVEQFEPGAWAEEIIESARRVEHRRLAQLYAVAARCYAAVRLDEGALYAEAGLKAIESGRYDAVPFDIPSELGGVYILRGDPHRWIRMCRNTLGESTDAHILTRAHLVMSLAMTGATNEAIEASEPLRNADSVTQNPAFVCWALLSYGYARHNTDPDSAYDAHRRGANIARETGNRLLETYHTGNLSRLAARHRDPTETFDYIATSIRNYFNAGNHSLLPQAMAVLANYLDRLGHHHPAATISGFSTTTFARVYFPEIEDTITHLREVLGDKTYESLAHSGATMTNAAMANYALEQIDLARADLVQTDESP